MYCIEFWVMIMNLEAQIIRMLWGLVERSNPYNLLKLSDGELIQQLIDEVTRVSLLSSDESENLAQYIRARILLIRDLADSKQDKNNFRSPM